VPLLTLDQLELPPLVELPRAHHQPLEQALPPQLDLQTQDLERAVQVVLKQVAARAERDESKELVATSWRKSEV